MNNFFLSCENSKNEIIKRAAEFTGRKSYFLIDYTGKVKRKSINLSLPLIAYSNSENMENVLEIISSNYIWKEERKKIKIYCALIFFFISVLTDHSSTWSLLLFSSDIKTTWKYLFISSWEHFSDHWQSVSKKFYY